MYDINVKVIKKGKNFFYIFFGMGLLFLIIFGGVFISIINTQKAVDSTTRSIRMIVEEDRDSDGDREYDKIFIYEVDGKEYECNGGSSYSRPTEYVEIIRYDKENPSTCIAGEENQPLWVFAIGFIVPVIFIIISVVNFAKIDKRVKMVKELNETGKLVKGIPYRMVPSGTVVNNVPILKPVIDYKLPSGSVIELQGDARFDRKTFDADGLVDLVIDESNPDNYFIDFEINRKDGNRDSDYYKIPEDEQQPKDPYQTNYGTYNGF